MTALEKYDRLEAIGLWRASADAQRHEVIVSVGNETLTFSNAQGQPIAHWSLAAVNRANQGVRPAIYHPDGDPYETLELAESEVHMIDAIEELRKAIKRNRPKPGRLRLMIFLLILAGIGLVGVIWLPDALRSHAVSVLPDVKKQQIGRDIMRHMSRVTGSQCRGAQTDKVLGTLSNRLDMAGTRLGVMRNGLRETISLPGDIILVGRNLVEDHEAPDVLAGYLAAEKLRGSNIDPLAQMMDQMGLWAGIKLLTTGNLPEPALETYAQDLLTQDPVSVDQNDLLEIFAQLEISAAPYAYAVDVSGETTLPLIEANPYRNTTAPLILEDNDWLRLQNICSG